LPKISVKSTFNADTLQGFTASGNWGLQLLSAGNPSSQVYSDSPKGLYSANHESTLNFPIVSLDGPNALVEFDSFRDLEEGYDYGFVEASFNGSTNWVPLKKYADEDNIWNHEIFELTPFLKPGKNTVQLRLRIKTDPEIHKDGFFVDNVVIKVPSN
jgi:hypothetical protein